MEDKKDDLGKARAGDPAYCIAKASLIKADVESLIVSIGLDQSGLKDIVNMTLDKAGEIIGEESMAGRFPILGYSYYEYGKTLMDKEPISALIYAQYALELSNIDLYFESAPKSGIVTQSKAFSIWPYGVYAILIFMIGLIFGIKANACYFRKYYTRKTKLKRKR